MDTVFFCFQIRSLDHRRFSDAESGKATPAGGVSPERMKEVDRALCLSLSCEGQNAPPFINKKLPTCKINFYFLY